MQAILIEPPRAKVKFRDDCKIPMFSGGAKTAGDIKGFWAIARCRPNHEKTLALVAEDSGFSYCLPLRNRKVVRPGNGSYETCSILQKLRGYVFLASEDEPEPGFNVSTDLWYFLADNFSTKGREIIQVRRSEQCRFVAEIQDVCDHVNDEDKPLVGLGDYCLITSGPFKGKEGRLNKTTNKGYACIEIKELKYAQWVEVDPKFLEITPEPV